jgi:ParB family chromosome partitioning protein
MPKNYVKKAEDQSIHLAPSNSNTDIIRKGERTDTSPFRVARMIGIDRIQPDPNQPRKTFVQETLESLAESIKEIGGIIDPLTVEYSENDDCYQIISGERRYRAAKISGLDKLPCVVKEVDEKTRYLIQFIVNLQREDIPPLEEAAGIKCLKEKYGYTQVRIAQILDKSNSYVSQILGLKRLSKQAQEIVQTSELSKEVLIQASREKDPEKQMEILNLASDGKKTVRQIRKGNKSGGKDLVGDKGESDKTSESKATSINNFSQNDTFTEWCWGPKSGGYEVIIRFADAQSCDCKLDLIQGVLKEAYENCTSL